MNTSQDTDRRLTPRAQRILDVASALFYAHGIHAVGVDTIAAESGVTKRTLYDRFGSKDALIADYLRRRNDAWWARAQQLLQEARPPRALALFDAYVDHPLGIDRGCAFLNAAAELPSDHPGYAIVREHKQAVRRRLAELLTADGITDPEATAEQLFLLLEGAIAHRGIDGDGHRIRHARQLAARLLQGG